VSSQASSFVNGYRGGIAANVRAMLSSIASVDRTPAWM
jgi:hypothetical protein